MPARRKPISGKQKKEQQQIKRAIKRGDLPPPEPQKKTRPRKGKSGPTGRTIGQHSEAVIVSARKLQSSFIKLPDKYLEDTKVIASTVPLPRPIDYTAALFHGFTTNREALSCPKRPKWRFDMSKKEVEHNEEGLFKKWLGSTDHLVEQWQQSREPEQVDANDTTVQEQPKLTAPPSLTYYERNLEVWRQLWRVTEISQIILVLLDSRCPLLHYPPSLSDYLIHRQVILVLTKVDITCPVRTEAWMNYFSEKYPTLRIIQVESYAEKEATTVHQGRKQYEPHIPETFRQKLVQAIKDVHHDMLQPPKRVLDNPEWLKKWVPPVKRDVDWDSVLNPSGDQVGTAVGGPAMPQSKTDGEREEEEEEDVREPDILTIGLIGQPNVGKSSLLNALFGSRRVRASKTPGKTKHFQTLFWTPEVRLVDCPGLVMPNYVEMEMQVLTGILPISRVSAIPSCITYVAKLLPLERIFKLEHPSSSQPPVEDKRTWREGMQPPKPKPLQWTAMDILISYAKLKGWVTAKAGRPDIHRAGNAILRALAEGRILWGFWPSDAPLEQIAKETSEPDTGIWIPGREPVEEEEHAEEHEIDYETQKEESESEPDDYVDVDSTTDRRLWFNLSRFAANLPVDESEGDEGASEEDVSEEDERDN